MEKKPTNPLTLGDLKEALQGLATKDDLKSLATQAALSTLTTTVTTIQETVDAIRDTTAATKEDMTLVKEDMKGMEGRLTTRLDRIEHLLLAKQEQRLNELEARMKKLEDALAVSPHDQSRHYTRAAFRYLRSCVLLPLPPLALPRRCCSVASGDTEDTVLTRRGGSTPGDIKK